MRKLFYKIYLFQTGGIESSFAQRLLEESITVIILGALCYFFISRYAKISSDQVQDLVKQRDKKQKEYQELQETYISDSKETIKAMTIVLQSIERLTHTINDGNKEVNQGMKESAKEIKQHITDRTEQLRIHINEVKGK